jgi:hypothetical protein
MPVTSTSAGRSEMVNNVVYFYLGQKIAIQEGK